MESPLGDLDLDGVYEVEHIALKAWPGLETFKIGGWIARFATGITRRANSVWPNEMSASEDVDLLLAQVESFYAARHLPARFQISPVARPERLDTLLLDRGYRAVAKTAVQTTSLAKLLAHLAGIDSPLVALSPQPSVEWWDCYTEADETLAESVEVREKICAAISIPTAYASAIRNGRVIAVGSAAASSRWIGYFNIATLPEYRRTGAARAVLAALSQWGHKQGATNAYLQVMADNEAALALYNRLGFTTGYYYHYREQVL